jgi:hypothetical protein
MFSAIFSGQSGLIPGWGAWYDLWFKFKYRCSGSSFGACKVIEFTTDFWLIVPSDFGDDFKIVFSIQILYIETI